MPSYHDHVVMGVLYEDVFEFAETRVKGGRSRGIDEKESDG